MTNRELYGSLSKILDKITDRRLCCRRMVDLYLGYFCEDQSKGRRKLSDRLLPIRVVRHKQDTGLDTPEVTAVARLDGSIESHHNSSTNLELST